MKNIKKLLNFWQNFFEIYEYKPKIISRKNITLDTVEGEIEL